MNKTKSSSLIRSVAIGLVNLWLPRRKKIDNHTVNENPATVVGKRQRILIKFKKSMARRYLYLSKKYLYLSEKYKKYKYLSKKYLYFSKQHLYFHRKYLYVLAGMVITTFVIKYNKELLLLLTATSPTISYYLKKKKDANDLMAYAFLKRMGPREELIQKLAEKDKLTEVQKLAFLKLYIKELVAWETLKTKKKHIAVIIALLFLTFVSGNMPLDDLIMKLMQFLKNGNLSEAMKRYMRKILTAKGIPIPDELLDYANAT